MDDSQYGIIVVFLLTAYAYLSRSAIVERDLAVRVVSVRLSHAGNASKLMNLGSCGCHRR